MNFNIGTKNLDRGPLWVFEERVDVYIEEEGRENTSLSYAFKDIERFGQPNISSYACCFMVIKSADKVEGCSTDAKVSKSVKEAVMPDGVISFFEINESDPGVEFFVKVNCIFPRECSVVKRCYLLKTFVFFPEAMLKWGDELLFF